MNLNKRAADLAKAGKLLRDTEVSRHSNSLKQTNSFGSLDNLDMEEIRPPRKILPIDRLANAVSALLEASLKPPAPPTVMEATPQQETNHNLGVLAVLGPQDEQLIASYLHQLNVIGFDMNLFTDMGFKGTFFFLWITCRTTCPVRQVV